ncbi:GntR family transcriptional regulator [Streptomyces sp. NPDC005046]
MRAQRWAGALYEPVSHDARPRLRRIGVALLRERIAAGSYPEGLPSEAEIGREFGVVRMTVRRAASRPPLPIGRAARGLRRCAYALSQAAGRGRVPVRV